MGQKFILGNAGFGAGDPVGRWAREEELDTRCDRSERFGGSKPAHASGGTGGIQPVISRVSAREKAL